MNCIFSLQSAVNLRISKNRISPYRSYSINVIYVEIVSTENDLGVVTVNGISWKDHILMIVVKGAAQELLKCCGVASLLFISAFALLLLLSVMGTSVCYQQFIPSSKSAKTSYTPLY